MNPNECVCAVMAILLFPEVTGTKSQRSLHVSGVQSKAAEADGAAHHSRQSQDSQQDGPPMSLQRMEKNIACEFGLLLTVFLDQAFVMLIREMLCITREAGTRECFFNYHFFLKKRLPSSSKSLQICQSNY